MTASDPELLRPRLPSTIDQRVTLHGVSWDQYEAMLAIRGDGAGVRMTYLEGELELMSPSADHESIKTIIARLLEAWADEVGLDLNGYGSWTVRHAPRERGLEPDECYVLGDRDAAVPDLAIEVVWTSGGLDKLEVYRGLGIPEVWIWEDGRLSVRVLRDEACVVAARSALLPALDLAQLASFVGDRNQSRAVRAYRAALRAT